MINKKIIKRTTAAAVAVSVAAMSAIPVYAQGKKLTVNDIINAIHDIDLMLDDDCRNTATHHITHRQPVVDVSGLPSKFDLRDVDGKNYV